MKVIFLDVDGVLNRTRTRNPRKLHYVIDPVLLRRFRQLAETTKARTVLASTWRYDPAGLYSARRQGLRFSGTTPDLPHRPRGDEIRDWLKRHPRVTRFAVIDDEDDGLDSLPLFQPDSDEGLTSALARRVARYLETDDDARRGFLQRRLQRLSAALRAHPG